LSLPGCFFASSTSSAVLAAGVFGPATSTNGEVATTPIGTRSLKASYLTVEGLTTGATVIGLETAKSSV
jgi:hypothetical protein